MRIVICYGIISTDLKNNNKVCDMEFYKKLKFINDTRNMYILLNTKFKFIKCLRIIFLILRNLANENI